MLNLTLLLSVFCGIALLLILILRYKVSPFISLLIASVFVGFLAGMPAEDIFKTIQEGMGNTLGFVATVVGLGAMFGAILEFSGGAESLAKYLLEIFGEKKASWALLVCGFLIAIPVFFDVAFIILVPVIYSLQRKTNKSLLLYGIPLLSGLAITHAFIPPTPGPIAVADILGANLGWVIIFGFVVGVPTAVVSGPLFARYISDKIFVQAPPLVVEPNKEAHNHVSVRIILIIIGLPIFLIVANSLLQSTMFASPLFPKWVLTFFALVGHPFSALIIANIVAWYFLGIRRNISKEILLQITTKAMAPAGIIILLTGAGGVFKQMLINTQTGVMLASYFSDKGISVLVFSFLAAALVRLLQGSSTVAMITAAGLTAPLLAQDMTDIHKALLVISIASGASILSHVNDSGFWLVSKYLGLTEKETFKSWSVMTTLLSLVGFGVCFLLFQFLK